MEFRALLVKLFNKLSDNDRQALHFSVGTKVSREIRDDRTSSGSLQLLDSLSDPYLIHVFEYIRCYYVSEQLKG
jgi:hypothetical protein